MALFVHLTPGGDSDSIRRAGVKPRRLKQPFHEGYDRILRYTGTGQFLRVASMAASHRPPTHVRSAQRATSSQKRIRDAYEKSFDN